MIKVETFDDVVETVSKRLKTDNQATKETILQLIEEHSSEECEVTWTDIQIIGFEE